MVCKFDNIGLRAEMGWPSDYSIVKLCSFVFLITILRVDDNLLLKVRSYTVLKQPNMYCSCLLYTSDAADE